MAIIFFLSNIFPTIITRTVFGQTNRNLMVRFRLKTTDFLWTIILYTSINEGGRVARCTNNFLCLVNELVAEINRGRPRGPVSLHFQRGANFCPCFLIIYQLGVKIYNWTICRWLDTFQDFNSR